MLLKDIIKQVNKLVGNGSSFRLNYAQLRPYIDSSIYYIGNYLRTPVVTPDEDWDNNIVLYSIVYSDKYKGLVGETTPTSGNYYFNEGIGQYTYYYNGVHYTINLETGAYTYMSSGGTSVTNYVTIIDSVDSVIDKYDYNLFPDQLIKSALIYLVTSSYLEEEDELESQYRAYQNRADLFLKEYRITYYSCIDCRWW